MPALFIRLILQTSTDGSNYTASDGAIYKLKHINRKSGLANWLPKLTSFMEKNSVPDSTIRTCYSSVCVHYLIFFFFAWPFHTLIGVGPTYHVSPCCSVLVVSLLTWVSLRFLFTRDIHVIRDLPRSRDSVSISD